MVECPYIGHDEAALQGQQLGAVKARQFLQHPLGFFQQPDFDPPPILGGTPAFDITLFFAARNQRDNAVMLRLQTLRKFPDRRPVATGITPDLQQQQVLQRLDSAPPGCLLAESHEFPDLMAKIRKYFKIMLIQGAGVGFGHGASIGR